MAIDLNEALAALLADAEARKDEIDQEREVLRDEFKTEDSRLLEDLQVLEREIVGFRAALERRGFEYEPRDGVTLVTGPAVDVLVWRRLPRTDAILRVLGELGEPSRPTVITEALRERGRAEESHDVSAALSYLKRTGRVRQVPPSRWTLAASEEGPA